MTPFTAFAIFVTAAVAHNHHQEPNAPAAQAPDSKAEQAVNRGKSYPANEVLSFKPAANCKDAALADPEFCGDLPKLSAMPTAEQEWIALARTAIKSFSLGFGQTEFGGNTPTAPVNLNTLQFFPEILKSGMNPKGYANLRTESDAEKGAKTIAYDLRTCALGGRVRAQAVDKTSSNAEAKISAFAVSEYDCTEMNFKSEPSVLSRVLSEVTRTQANTFELQSQGQVGRSIGAVRYAGSVANLKQVIDMNGNTTTIDYVDGAIGYCINKNPQKTQWGEQCLQTGVVMDELRLRKEFQAQATRFPGVSYIKLVLADGVDEKQQAKQRNFEMVGKDIAIQNGAFAPTQGMMTIVGREGERIRVEFQGDKALLTRLNAQSGAIGTATVSARQIMTTAGYPG